MNDFLNCIVKYSLVIYILTAILLLCLAGVLFFIPGMIKNIIYYCVILACTIGAVGIIISLLRIGICMRREK
ncbi:MAG: hypothetical protein IJ379_05505 [Lachnospiraceae bacterium]|nr:hypothetical protein [Lachnospiraceae bacterium]